MCGGEPVLASPLSCLFVLLIYFLAPLPETEGFVQDLHPAVSAFAKLETFSVPLALKAAADELARVRKSGPAGPIETTNKRDEEMLSRGIKRPRDSDKKLLPDAKCD